MTDAGFEGSRVTKNLVDRFGGLSDALHADPGEIERATGEARLARLIISTRQLIEELHHDDIRKRPIVRIDEGLLAYLRFVLGYAAIERLHVLFLDSGSRLITSETFNEGTVDQVEIHVREILARAIRIGAAGLILSHNHPSGEARASRNDIEMTRKLCAGARALNLAVYDHIIVARDQWYSLRMEGLL